jgi:hypothetical protein
LLLTYRKMLTEALIGRVAVSGRTRPAVAPETALFPRGFFGCRGTWKLSRSIKVLMQISRRRKTFGPGAGSVHQMV